MAVTNLDGWGTNLASFTVPTDRESNSDADSMNASWRVAIEWALGPE